MLPFSEANQFDSPYLNRFDYCTDFDLEYQPQPNNSNQPWFQPVKNKRRFSVYHSGLSLVADLVDVELFCTYVKNFDCSVDAINDLFWGQFLNDVFDVNRVGKENGQQFVGL